MQPAIVIKDSSVVKKAKTMSVRHPTAFIMPISCMRSDVMIETRKDVTRTPAKEFSITTISVNLDRTTDNPTVSLPVVAEESSAPRFSPKRMKNVVMATQMARFRVVITV
jgi:hypothetical protein